MIKSGVVDVTVCMGGFRCFLFKKASNLLKTIYGQHGPCMQARLINVSAVETYSRNQVATAYTDGARKENFRSLRGGGHQVGWLLCSSVKVATV